MSVVLLAVLKASVILSVALLLAAFASRTRAAVRHLVLAVAFVALLVLPIAIALLPDVPVPVPMPMRQPEVPVELVAPSFESKGETIVTGASADREPVVTGPVRFVGAEEVIGAVWIVGVFIALVPLAVGLRELRRLRRRASSWDEGAIVLAELARERQCRRQVAVLIHQDVPGPMTCGVLRPAIVFPPDVTAWDQSDVRRALRHELEHVGRADCLVDAVARLTCALYWFHPLAWMAWRQLRLEAERACDDAVLIGSEPIAYAEQLVSLAARVTDARAPLLAMAGARDLPRRVAAVLDRAQRRGRAGAVWTTVTLAVGLGFAGLVAPLCAAWQSAEAPRVSFEVASIKENTSGDPFGGGEPTFSRIYPGGRLSMRNQTLHDMVLLAYRFEIGRSQLAGVEPWMDRSRFDVEARAAEGVIAPGALDRPRAEMIDRMFQALLAERFKLRIRRETRPGEVYVLAVAPDGAKLPPSTIVDLCRQAEHAADVSTVKGLPPPGCHNFTYFGRRGMSAPAVDAADIADVLGMYLQRPVIDRTGLTGLYQVEAHWSPGTPSRSTPLNAEPEVNEDDPDPVTAVRQQLGLRLDLQRAPIETLIIEHAEAPTAN